MKHIPYFKAMETLPAHVSTKIIEDICGCWIWTGADSGKGRGGGYGRTSYLGCTTAVHLLVWRLTGQRTLRAGEQLDHTCVNRRCCNPAHLEPRTQSMNMKLAYKRRKQSAFAPAFAIV